MGKHAKQIGEPIIFTDGFLTNLVDLVSIPYNALG
jgi:hypothetical protein